MKKIHYFFIILITLSSSLAKSSPSDILYKISYGVEVSLESKNLKSFNIYLPLPADTKYQKTESLSINIPGKIFKSSKHSLKYILFDLTKELKAGNKATILINSKIKITKTNCDIQSLKIYPYNRESYLYKTFTREEPYLHFNKRKILTHSRYAKEASLIKKIIYFYDITIKTLKKKSVFKGLRRLKNILKTETGECSDFSSLFVALCRASGIPARHVVGRVINKNIKNSFHVWAEVFLEKHGWIAVDTFWKKGRKRVIGNIPSNFIILHKGINIPLNGSTSINAPMLQTYYYICIFKKPESNVKIKYIWKTK